MTIEITDHITLDEAELEFTYIRATGSGGQNVNKVSSAAQMRFNIRRSPSLPAWVAIKAQQLAGKRLTKDGVIVITANRHRTQEQNRSEAIERLVELLKEASVRQAIRRATKPTLGSKRRRLDGKSKRGEVKKMRGKPNMD
jgi:ribosome-associated protein